MQCEVYKRGPVGTRMILSDFMKLSFIYTADSICYVARLIGIIDHLSIHYQPPKFVQCRQQGDRKPKRDALGNWT